MKAYLLTLSLLCLALPAEGAGYKRLRTSTVITAEPATPAGQVAYASEKAIEQATGRRGGRGLASIGGGDPNRELCDRIQPGQRYMLRNSLYEYDDQVVSVVDKFEDCSVRVKLPAGQKAFVKLKNLTRSLAAEVDCVPAHGTTICKGDTVFYPSRTSSMDLPEAPVEAVFEHGVIVVNDGADFVLDATQVGKNTDCSPQKENICVGDYVYAEGFKKDQKFNFEGPIKKTYSNGVVVVESDHFWKYPIDVTAVKKRVMSADGDRSPASVGRTGHRVKDMPFNVTPEIEPDQPTAGDTLRNDR